MARTRKRSAGPSAMELRQRAVLGKLLSCLLPPETAARAAGELLEVFGSLSEVLVAPEKELLEIAGMNSPAARLLGATAEAARETLEDQASGLRRVYDTESAASVLFPKLAGRKTEAVVLLLLDGQKRVIYNNIVCEGAISEVPMYIRKIVSLCIDHDAAFALLAHNHPSGQAMPSRNDVVVTRQVELALESVQVPLSDHLVFGSNGCFSFAASDAWNQGRMDMWDFQREQLEIARAMEREYLEKQGGRGDGF